MIPYTFKNFEEIDLVLRDDPTYPEYWFNKFDSWEDFKKVLGKKEIEVLNKFLFNKKLELNLKER